MIWGLLFTAVIGAALFASDLFWELLAGIALFGAIAGAIQLDPAMFLTGAVLLVACCWRWARWV
jgi:hypothetical protein